LKKLFLLVVSILLCAVSVSASSQSAVITLEFPGGAENTGLGECGVSHAKNIYTLFWNPASLPAVYDETYSNIIFGHFHEVLLPLFQVPDLYHNFTPFCLLLNKVVPHIDISYGCFENYISFGTNDWTDIMGNVMDSAFSDETVWAHTLAVRAFDIFSAGITFKTYNSRLAPGYGIGDDGIATGIAYDVGFRIGKKIPLFDIIELQPALGLSFLNLWGDSAKYIHDRTDTYEPIGKTIIYGGSMGFNVLDLFEYTYIREISRSMLAGSWHEKTDHWGERFQITPFYCRIQGKMIDSVGNRHERTQGDVVTLNFRKSLEMLEKVVRFSDRLNHTSYCQTLVSWDEEQAIGKYKIKPNFYFSFAHNSIETTGDNDSREGQSRFDWTLGIGILGNFPTYISNCKLLQTAPPRMTKEPIKTEKSDSTRTLENHQKIKSHDEELFE
jgi:hypothetical protein